jgi:hypothetical protein
VLTAPRLLARFGVASWLELRAQLPSAVVQQPAQGDTRIDADNFEVGVAVAGKLASHLSASLVPNLTLPVGDAPPAADGVEGRIQGNLDFTPGSRFALDIAVQTGWQAQAARDGDTEAQLTMLGGALLRVNASETVFLFVQNYCEYVSEQDVEPVVGGGGGWYVTPRALLFAEANRGLSRDSPPFSLNAGAAVQWW